MERRKASDFPQEVLDLFDGYVHGTMNRRQFIDRATKYAIGGFTAAAMLESLSPNFAWAQQVAKDDARIKTEVVTYPSPQGSGTMRGYLAWPAKAAGKLPGVLVIHENRGLNPYIEDVARRLAVEGYVAFAPDALAPVGGYPGNEDKARELFAKLDPKKRFEDLYAGAGVLKARPECNGKIGDGRLLFRRPGREPAGSAHSGPCSGRPVLRQAGQRRGHRQDQGAASHPLRRAR